MEISVIFIELDCQNGISQRVGKINIENRVRDAMTVLVKNVGEHGGKVVKTTQNQILAIYTHRKKSVQSACQMQQLISYNDCYASMGIALKIGAHYGTATMSRDSISGEVIAVAKKLREVAKPSQIVITKEVQKDIPISLGIELKKCGAIRLKDQIKKTDLFEVLWDASDDSQTCILDGSNGSHEKMMILKYKGKNYQLGKDRNSYLVGRGNQNDLIIEHSAISRAHAQIQYTNGVFKVIDHSSNGTFIAIEGKSEVKIQKSEILLEKSGVLSLGQSTTLASDEIIHFEVLSL